MSTPRAQLQLRYALVHAPRRVDAAVQRPRLISRHVGQRAQAKGQVARAEGHLRCSKAQHAARVQRVRQLPFEIRDGACEEMRR